MQSIIPPTLSYATPPEEGVNLRRLGLAQRRMAWLITATLLLGVTFIMSRFFPLFGITPQLIDFVQAAVLLVGFATWIVVMIAMYRLTEAMEIGVGGRVFYVAVMLIPGINLVMLWAVNQNAVDLLRRNGIAVGWMGARLADLPLA